MHNCYTSTRYITYKNDDLPTNKYKQTNEENAQVTTTFVVNIDKQLHEITLTTYKMNYLCDNTTTSQTHKNLFVSK